MTDKTPGQETHMNPHDAHKNKLTKAEQKAKTEKALKPLMSEKAKDGDIITPADIAARAKYVERFNKGMGKTVEGVIECGMVLVDAKEGPKKLKHGQFIPMVEEDLKMDRKDAHKIMEIARNPHLSNVGNFRHLPPTWTTLYQLSKVPPHRLEALLEKGKITPHITGKEVKELLPKNKSTKKKKYETEDDPEEETTTTSVRSDETEAFIADLDKESADGLLKAFMWQVHGAITALGNCNAVLPEIMKTSQPHAEDIEAMIKQTRELGDKWHALADYITGLDAPATRRRKPVIA